MITHSAHRRHHYSHCHCHRHDADMSVCVSLCVVSCRIAVAVGGIGGDTRLAGGNDGNKRWAIGKVFVCSTQSLSCTKSNEHIFYGPRYDKLNSHSDENEHSRIVNITQRHTHTHSHQVQARERTGGRASIIVNIFGEMKMHRYCINTHISPAYTRRNEYNVLVSCDFVVAQYEVSECECISRALSQLSVAIVIRI